MNSRYLDILPTYLVSRSTEGFGGLILELRIRSLERILAHVETSQYPGGSSASANLTLCIHYSPTM